jgi:hypothetical protein
MSRVYELAELLQDAGFCDYIQDWAVRTGRNIVRCMIKF